LRLLSLLITVPVALFVLSFALTNRAAVTLGLWPLPFTLDLPVWAIGLGAMALGIVVGGLVGWFAGHRGRARRRRAERRTAELGEALAAAEARAATAEKRLAAFQTTPVNANAPIAQGMPAVLPITAAR
jgi:lipopolysaccharide assembly protein A